MRLPQDNRLVRVQIINALSSLRPLLIISLFLSLLVRDASDEPVLLLFRDNFRNIESAVGRDES